MTANPILDPEAWDVIVVDGDELPGLALVEDVERKYKWDEKKGKSTKGNALGFQGFDNAEFSCTLQFADQFDDAGHLVISGIDQIDQWHARAPTLQPDPDPKKVKALDVVHPALEPLGIRSVVMLSIGGITNAGKGLFTVKLKMKEFVKPTPASGSPTGSSSNGTASGSGGRGGGNPQPTAQDAQDREIARLNAEANKP